MVSYYKGTKVKYPSLFFEVSEGLKYNLESNKIEHTKTEISLLRKFIIEDLNKEGINQKTYNQDDHFFIKSGVTLYHIDKFYGTTLAKKFRQEHYGF